MTAVAVPEAVEARMASVRDLLSASGTPKATQSPTQKSVTKAFERVAEKEELIDGLASGFASPYYDRQNREHLLERIELIREEIAREYEDLIVKLDLQIALGERGLL